jgi:ribosome-binding protein aMBF1 (putative translation factor)
MNTFTKHSPGRNTGEKTFLPQSVVEKVAVEGKSLIHAWREYKNMSQEDLACRMRITDSVFRVLEKANNRLSSASIKKIATALEVTEEQLRI